MPDLKQFTLEEVSEHNTRESPYLIIHDKVYDVKDFLDEHPGGEEVLLEQGGKDSTESFEDVGHSTDAKDLMAQYLVGEIVEHQRSKKETKSRKFEDLPSDNLESSGWKQWSIMIGLAIISVIVYRTYY